jgi:hypothetical protein
MPSVQIICIYIYIYLNLTCHQMDYDAQATAVHQLSTSD